MKRPSTVEELLALNRDQLREALGLVDDDCERCIYCEDCEGCARCEHCKRCERCVRCIYCEHCVDCIGCCDKHDKHCMVWDIQLTESQYREVRVKLRRAIRGARHASNAD